jgi:hypothetical protein
LADAQPLPHGRDQAGDRHLNFHGTRDNFGAPPRRAPDPGRRLTRPHDSDGQPLTGCVREPKRVVTRHQRRQGKHQHHQRPRCSDDGTPARLEDVASLVLGRAAPRRTRPVWTAHLRWR